MQLNKMQNTRSEEMFSREKRERMDEMIGLIS